MFVCKQDHTETTELRVSGKNPQHFDVDIMGWIQDLFSLSLTLQDYHIFHDFSKYNEWVLLECVKSDAAWLNLRGLLEQWTLLRVILVCFCGY